VDARGCGAIQNSSLARGYIQRNVCNFAKQAVNEVHVAQPDLNIAFVTTTRASSGAMEPVLRKQCGIAEHKVSVSRNSDTRSFHFHPSTSHILRPKDTLKVMPALIASHDITEHTASRAYDGLLNPRSIIRTSSMAPSGVLEPLVTVASQSSYHNPMFPTNQSALEFLHRWVTSSLQDQSDYFQAVSMAEGMSWQLSSEALEPLIAGIQILCHALNNAYNQLEL
jgi:hypothetical protein